MLRDAITHPVCALAFSLVALTTGGSSQQPERPFASPACHVSFAYPADWVVRPDSGAVAEPCSFVIRPVAWDSLLLEADSVDLYTIGVRVAQRGFEAALGESPFERRDTTWVVLGRQGIESPANAITRNGWRGVWGTATIGCFRIEGGNAGLCDVPTALVGTEAYSATLEGGPRSDDVFDRLLHTLAFHP